MVMHLVVVCSFQYIELQYKDDAVMELTLIYPDLTENTIRSLHWLAFVGEASYSIAFFGLGMVCACVAKPVLYARHRMSDVSELMRVVSCMWICLEQICSGRPHRHIGSIAHGVLESLQPADLLSALPFLRLRAVSVQPAADHRHAAWRHVDQRRPLMLIPMALKFGV
ncbi:unnamed protein product [Effrenium voratum]|nr:unnamed protein product [Effrenium voratum]